MDKPETTASSGVRRLAGAEGDAEQADHGDQDLVPRKIRFRPVG
jgi:hypothetical protein